MDLAELLAALSNGPDLSGASCAAPETRELLDSYSAVIEAWTLKAVELLGNRAQAPRRKLRLHSPSQEITPPHGRSTSRSRTEKSGRRR